MRHGAPLAFKVNTISITKDIYLIRQYFPNYPKERIFEYFQHHCEGLIACVENKLFSSAYYHLHILYMTFTYIQLSRIAKKRPIDFMLCQTGSQSSKRHLINGEPFAFSRISERTVFRYFRTVDFKDHIVKDLASLIKNRNKRMHATGKIFFETKVDFENEYLLYLTKMENIIREQKKFIEPIYDKLTSDYDTDYEITDDDLTQNFVIQYSFSNYELKYLAGCKQDTVSKFIRDNQ